MTIVSFFTGKEAVDLCSPADGTANYEKRSLTFISTEKEELDLCSSLNRTAYYGKRNDIGSSFTGNKAVDLRSTSNETANNRNGKK